MTRYWKRSSVLAIGTASTATAAQAREYPGAPDLSSDSAQRTDVLDQLRNRAAKWAFTTRRVNRADIAGISTAFEDAVAGDLLVGRIAEIGQHKKVQLASGRASECYIDDLVVMCVGDRYASDQFEGHAVIDADGCDMIAGGGIVGRVVHAHETMDEPTRISCPAPRWLCGC